MIEPSFKIAMHGLAVLAGELASVVVNNVSSVSMLPFCFCLWTVIVYTPALINSVTQYNVPSLSAVIP